MCVCVCVFVFSLSWHYSAVGRDPGVSFSVLSLSDHAVTQPLLTPLAPHNSPPHSSSPAISAHLHFPLLHSAPLCSFLLPSVPLSSSLGTLLPSPLLLSSLIFYIPFYSTPFCSFLHMSSKQLSFIDSVNIQVDIMMIRSEPKICPDL